MPAIYFDYNATTPVDPAVRAAVAECERLVFANPSSVHRLGRQARAALDEARERVACCWNCKPGEVVFTSGATEAANLAVLGVARHTRRKGRHIVTSAIEHPAVLEPCRRLKTAEGCEVSVVPCSHEGRIEPEQVAAALRDDTILVSIMAANNEIGTIQDVAAIGRICQDRRILFHTDAAQWFGKLPVASIHQFNADLVSVCGHKFHGPKGAGALFIRSGVTLEPLLLGGAQENDHRAGTENLPVIVGFALAVERFTKTPVFDSQKLQNLTDRLEAAARSWPRVTVLGRRDIRLHNTVALTVEGTDSLTVLANLDLEGICASSGSACSAGALEPSHVVQALGLPQEQASALVRFSLGRESTTDEVDFLIRVMPLVLERIRVCG